MVMQSPLFAEMQRRRQQQFAGAITYGIPSPLTGMPVTQDERMPGGLYQVLGNLVRGGKPWDHIPDPNDEPAMFRDWARGYVRHPLVWEGDYA